MNVKAVRMMAWQRVWEGLDDLAKLPDHPSAVGFICALRGVAEALSSDDEPHLASAMKTLEAGFRKRKKAVQDAPKLAKQTKTQLAWDEEKRARRRSKKAFSLDYSERMAVSVRTVERWLSGR